VEKDLDDDGTVAREVALIRDHVLEPLAPDLLRDEAIGKALGRE
jgi:hypothetical protein